MPPLSKTKKPEAAKPKLVVKRSIKSRSRATTTDKSTKKKKQKSAQLSSSPTTSKTKKTTTVVAADKKQLKSESLDSADPAGGDSITPKDKQQEWKSTTCPICYKQFSDSSTRRRHQITHLPNSKPFSCGQCGKTFTQSYTMKIHIKEIHEGALGSFPCQFCPKVLRRSKDLARHLQTHGPKSPKSIVKQEDVIHTCEICGSTFMRKHNLLNHLEAVHDVIDPDYSRNFCCEQCPKTYRRQWSLNEHIQSVHQKQ